MRHELVTTTYLPGGANAVAQAAAKQPAAGLAGYWVTEIGTLNQTVELWSGARPAVPDADSVAHSSWPMTAVTGPAAPLFSGGVYEMRHYRLRQGMTAAWVEIFTAALPARQQYSRIVALLASDPGEEDRVVHIWAYPDLNTRVAARANALRDPIWQDFLGKSRAQKMVIRQDVSIMLPASHSPLA
jgi:hypothetical protein